jgi:hypothetical protein
MIPPVIVRLGNVPKKRNPRSGHCQLGTMKRLIQKRRPVVFKLPRSWSTADQPLVLSVLGSMVATASGTSIPVGASVLGFASVHGDAPDDLSLSTGNGASAAAFRSLKSREPQHPPRVSNVNAGGIMPVVNSQLPSPVTVLPGASALAPSAEPRPLPAAAPPGALRLALWPGLGCATWLHWQARLDQDSFELEWPDPCPTESAH